MWTTGQSQGISALIATVLAWSHDSELPVYAIVIVLRIRSSYFISGFSAGNKMIDLYVILAMPFNSFLVVVIYIIEIPSFYFGNAT